MVASDQYSEKSLVQTISKEIGKQLGVEEQDLAEYIIALHLESASVKDFQTRLGDAGAEFPTDFVHKLNLLIRQRHPKYSKDVKSVKQEAKVGKSGLAIPDDVEYVKKIETDIKQTQVPKDEPRDAPKREASPERGRKRRRSSSPKPKRPVHDEPEVDAIYDARVTSIKNFGAFATLQDFRRRVDGLIHISQFTTHRIESPSEIVREGDMVKVKLIGINNGKISLSMKNIDQKTGQEENQFVATGANATGRESKQAFTYNSSKQKKRATSQDRFERRQLAAAGIKPDMESDDDDDAVSDGEDAQKEEEEEDIYVEIREETAPFLEGEAKQTRDLSPVRIVKAPQGSMSRTAADSARELNQWKEEKKRKEKELEAARANGENVEEDNSTSNGSAAQRALKPAQRTKQSIQEQRESLPVYIKRRQIMELVKRNQICVIVGHTGSGKTTQITQFLYEDGYSSSGLIGCTQPRQVAAKSVAQRVAEERGCRIGQEVGYAVRFDDKTSDRTKIKYMTDGILQREALNDPLLSRYSVIVLDEAHERSIATDVLFALLKKAVEKRGNDFKVIITSATLNAEKFSEYFNDCEMTEIEGKLYPVNVTYTLEPVLNYMEAALKTVVEIHLTQPAGDILVFLTGRDEIDASIERLNAQMKSYGGDVPELIALAVYSQMPADVQARIFEPAPPGARKVIFATNIAETSLTIEGIYFVVDPGFVKLNAFDPRYGMDKLMVSPISKAQADQRKGRAGRTGPGKCYRLYTEDAFNNEMMENTIPEILRQNLANTLLMLKAMGINDLVNFEFMDPPPHDSLTQALEHLYQLGALDGSGLLTKLGRQMADFPEEPALSKVLINSADFGCAEEILTILAMVNQAEKVFIKPSDKNDLEVAQRQKARFNDPFGDHLTLLNVYNAWVNNGRDRLWCQRNYINPRQLEIAQNIRDQLVRHMRQNRLAIRSCGNKNEVVRKTICSGFFFNCAKRDPQEGYKTMLGDTPVYLHPSSALFYRPATMVIYQSLVQTAKEYMSIVTAIEPKWLPEVAPTFFKVADSKSMTNRRRQEKIEPLQQSRYAAKGDWRLSTQKRIRN